MTGRHSAPLTGSAAREATASPYVGEHCEPGHDGHAGGNAGCPACDLIGARTCARCGGYLAPEAGFYEVSVHLPPKDGRSASPKTLYFDGLDHLREYVTAQDEAFPVRAHDEI